MTAFRFIYNSLWYKYSRSKNKKIKDIADVTFEELEE